MTPMNGSTRVALAALILSSLVPGSALGRQAVPKLLSVRTVNEGGTIAVIIDANGTLPMPVDGSVENPPRLFFDFEGVLPARTGVVTTPGAGVVRQTRVARYAPDVTRVVLDLVRPESYRIEADERATGRIKIFVGSGSPTAAVAAPPARTTTPKPSATTPPPLPPLDPVAHAPKPTPTATPPAASAPPPAVTKPPANDTPATPAPAAEPTYSRRPPAYARPPSAPKPPAREVERYRQRLSGAIERLEAQQPVMILIDAEGSISTEALEAAVSEFTSVRRLLEGIKPSEALSSAHELLVASCTLGATASRLGIEASRESNAEARKNAASAAAGALMFFDRACADLGCTRPQQ